MQRIPAYLTDAQRQRLDTEQERTGLGYAEIMRRALDQYLPGAGSGSFSKKGQACRSVEAGAPSQRLA